MDTGFYLEIVIINPYRVIRANTHESIYDSLVKYGISEEIAIDCASWAEIACEGESYNEELFDAYVRTEDKY